ncbi:MAG: hypothetical protein M1812_001701 [Candelaria pacifica]|nr:MAG: hypothetical protein M1812_001701 [Candelaria pacifica]
MEVQSATTGNAASAANKKRGDDEQGPAEVVKKTRQKVACNECARRRIGCDARQPVCSKCVIHKTTCVYPARGDYKDSPMYQEQQAKISSLEERVDVLEERVDILEAIVKNLLAAREGSPVPGNEALPTTSVNPVLTGSQLDYWEFSGNNVSQTTSSEVEFQHPASYPFESDGYGSFTEALADVDTGFLNL